MSRRKKIVVTVMSCAAGVVLVGIGISASSMLPGSWTSALSHWPQVPPPELYVTAQPKPEDIPGTYLLTRQTISANGLAALEGRQCRLELRPDGSFTVTNYPQWSSYSSEKPHVTALTSTSGRWRCDKIPISFRGRSCWGVVFADAPAAIDTLALRSKGAPYDLMLTYGDGDDGAIMMFQRKK